jgi:hypothetical protein
VGTRRLHITMPRETKDPGDRTNGPGAMAELKGSSTMQKNTRLQPPGEGPTDDTD